MRDWVVRCVVVIALWFCAASSRADDTVRLDPVLQRFDGRFPSSAKFIFEIPAPGTESVRGTVELWPGTSPACSAPGSRQYHRLALISSGTGADRVLRANVPPLQVDTNFCIRVKLIRGLDDARAVGFAASVVSNLRVNYDGKCAGLPSRLVTALATAIDDASTARVNRERELTPATVQIERASQAIPSTSSTDAASAVIAGIDLVSLCTAYAKATSDRAQTAESSGVVETTMKAANAAVRIPAPTKDQRSVRSPLLANAVKAPLPVYLSGAPGAFEIRLFENIADEDKELLPAARQLQQFSAAAAEKLRDVANAKPEERKKARDEYVKTIASLKPQQLWVHYVIDGQIFSAPVDKLFSVERISNESDEAFAKRVTEANKLIVENLDLLRRQFAALQGDNARTWFLALESMYAADAAYRAAGKDLAAKDDAVVAAREAFGTKLRERIAAADVRALITSVTDIELTQKLVSSQTEEGASRFAADIGVLVAIPMHWNLNRTGWEPWLVPYAGVNIYAQPVDRVVPFDELVGGWAAQRLSLTIGALLTRPKLNDEQISTPFRDSGLVPVAALGVRLTSFTRASLGGFFFDYADDNPATTKKHHGGAVWIGLSVDADIWSAVQGKAFSSK